MINVVSKIATGTADILRYLMTHLDHPDLNEIERLEDIDFDNVG